MSQIPESVRRRMQGQAAGEHPDADLLTAFAEQALAGQERERVLLHLAACASCRDVVSLAALEQREPAEVAAPATSWFRWPVLRWTAVAAAVIVVGAAVSVLVERNRPTEVAVPAQQSEQPTNAPQARVAEKAEPKLEARQSAGAKKPATAREKRAKQETVDGSLALQTTPPAGTTTRDVAVAGAAPMSVTKPAERAAANAKTKALDEEAFKKEMARKDGQPVDLNGANAVVTAEATKADRAAYADKISGAAAAPLNAAGPPPPPPPPAPVRNELASAKRAGAGVIAGRVTDPSGAVVPNALVKITNTKTNTSESVRTDETGAYRFAAVTPGVYSVEASAPGMQVAKTNELDVNGIVAQNLMLRPGAAAETVSVTAEQQPVPGAMHGNAAATVPATPPPPATARNEAAKAMRSGAAGGVVSGAPMTLSKSRTTVAGRWRVSSAGAVEHSDDGSAWEKVDIDPGVTFRAISSNNGDLWAGGTGGALFHSTDAGRTWSRVKVGMEGMWVSDTISGVSFPTQSTGYVTTASGMTWMTQDAGRSWNPR